MSKKLWFVALVIAVVVAVLYLWGALAQLGQY